MPNLKEQWSLAKSIKRTYLTDANKMVKRDWMYESDDDEGEDLGSNAGDDDYDEVLEEGEEG